MKECCQGLTDAKESIHLPGQSAFQERLLGFGLFLCSWVWPRWPMLNRLKSCGDKVAVRSSVSRPVPEEWNRNEGAYGRSLSEDPLAALHLNSVGTLGLKHGGELRDEPVSDVRWYLIAPSSRHCGRVREVVSEGVTRVSFET